MADKRAIGSIAELYTHALAVEREAAARYAELAEFMADHDNRPVAELFARLAQIEEEHADAIVARARGLQLPALRSYEHAWFDAGPPETVAHEFVFRLMTPHDALKVALEAEQRARAYFEEVFANATDPDVKMLAAAMIQEEQQHIDWVERALATDPDPHLDWDRLFAQRRVVLPPGPGVDVPVRAATPKAPKRTARPATARKKPAARKPVSRRKPAPKRKAVPKGKTTPKRKVAKTGAARRAAAKPRKAAAKKKAARRR
jgi:rubrerythrin